MIFFMNNIDYLHIAHTLFAYYFPLHLLTGIVLPLCELYHFNVFVNLEYFVLQFLHVLAVFWSGFFSCLNRKLSLFLLLVFSLMEGK